MKSAISNPRTSFRAEPQLQQATGIDAAQLSKLLKADGNPTLYTLQRVADALGKRLVFSLAEK